MVAPAAPMEATSVEVGLAEAGVAIARDAMGVVNR